MRRFVAFGLVSVLLASATGCGGPDALVKQFIVQLNAFAETVEKKESPERQQAALDRVKATGEKIDKLKMSQEERDKLLQKYEPELKKAEERIKAAYTKQVLEGGPPPPKALDGFFK